MKPFGIFLSGCGYEEGTDIYEAVLLHYFLEEKKIKAVYLFSPPDDEERAKGDVIIPQIFTRKYFSEMALMSHAGLKKLKETGSDSLESLILPGGEGILKKYTRSEEKNPILKIDADLKKFIRETYRRKKPIAGCGLACLAIASSLRDIVTSPLTLTLGNDPKLSDQLEKMGVNHVITKSQEAIIDSENRLVTTAGSKMKTSLGELGVGLKNLIDGILELTK